MEPPSGARTTAEKSGRSASWRAIARRQDEIVTRAQLVAAGVDRGFTARRVTNGDWQTFGSRVVMTAPGVPSREQQIRIALLHPLGRAVLVGRWALELHGLSGWERGPLVVFVRFDDRSARHPPAQINYVRTRHDLGSISVCRRGFDVARVEVCSLTLASALAVGRWGEKASPRAAGGLLAAVVQQRLTTADALIQWLPRLSKLPRSRLLKAFLDDIAGGSQSMAEIDLVTTCRDFSVAPPRRQRRRRDTDGRFRYIDAEWDLPDGTTLVLEVDGSFHRNHHSWEEDLRRQRRIGDRNRRVIHCTAIELRCEPEEVVKDLVVAGVPRLR